MTYYLKEDISTHRTAAFAYTGGVLLLATKGDLIAGALELMAPSQRPSIASESWFSDAVKAAAGRVANQLRMVYNLERLIATPHFRSYWVQRNVSDLREFRCGLADLEQSRGGFQERRVLLRATAGSRDRGRIGLGSCVGAGSGRCGVLSRLDQTRRRMDRVGDLREDFREYRVGGRRLDQRSRQFRTKGKRAA